MKASKRAINITSLVPPPLSVTYTPGFFRLVFASMKLKFRSNFWASSVFEVFVVSYLMQRGYLLIVGARILLKLSWALVFGTTEILVGSGWCWTNVVDTKPIDPNLTKSGAWFKLAVVVWLWSAWCRSWWSWFCWGRIAKPPMDR